MTTEDKGVIKGVHICTTDSAYTALTKNDDELYFVPDSGVTQTEMTSAIATAKAEIEEELDDKQDTLTAGTNITIANNVISASGGGGSSVTTTISTVSQLLTAWRGDNEAGSITFVGITITVSIAGGTHTIQIPLGGLSILRTGPSTGFVMNAPNWITYDGTSTLVKLTEMTILGSEEHSLYLKYYLMSDPSDTYSGQITESNITLTQGGNITVRYF